MAPLVSSVARMCVRSFVINAPEKTGPSVARSPSVSSLRLAVRRLRHGNRRPSLRGVRARFAAADLHLGVLLEAAPAERRNALCLVRETYDAAVLLLAAEVALPLHDVVDCEHCSPPNRWVDGNRFLG